MLHPIKLLFLWYLVGLATLHSRESPHLLQQQQTQQQTQQTRAAPPSSCWAHLKATWWEEGLPAASYAYFDKTGPCRRRVDGKQQEEKTKIQELTPPQRTDLQHSIIHHLLHTFAAPLTLLPPRLRKRVQDFCWETMVGLGTLLLEWQPWAVAKSMEAWEYVKRGEAAAAVGEAWWKMEGEVRGTLQEKTKMARQMGRELMGFMLEKTKKGLAWSTKSGPSFLPLLFLAHDGAPPPRVCA